MPSACPAGVSIELRSASWKAPPQEVKVTVPCCAKAGKIADVAPIAVVAAKNPRRLISVCLTIPASLERIQNFIKMKLRFIIESTCMEMSMTSTSKEMDFFHFYKLLAARPTIRHHKNGTSF
ncbi:MAG: hypothetical protein IOC49_04290 [Methylobacterium sp.]|nr:hypothetical protein [Methylobacterium sp.]